MADEDQVLPKFPSDSLVCCYHMLEHIPDPRVGLKKIYDSMDDTCVFHVEVPCECAPFEPEKPNLDAGHLFNFADAELGTMAREIGFIVHYKKFAYSKEVGWYDTYILSKNKKHYGLPTLRGKLTSPLPLVTIVKYNINKANTTRH